MRVTCLTAAMAFGLLAFVSAAPADAQTAPPAVREGVPGAAQPPRVLGRAPTRIVVSPNQRIYRACEGWLAVEHRPSGDVITPQRRCWWAVR